MTIRTRVTATVRPDLFDEVFDTLQSVNPEAILAFSYGSNSFDGTVGLSISLSGDLRDVVGKELEAFPDVKCKIEVTGMEAG